MGWFDKEENSSGRLATSLEEDTMNIRGAVSDQVSAIAQNLTVLATGFIIAFVNQWKLTLVILATLPLLMIAVTMQMHMMAGFDTQTDKLYSHTKQLVADALGNVRTVGAYGLDQQMVDLYSEAQSGPRATQLRRANISGAGFGLGQAIFMCLYALAFWYGGILVDHGQANAGNVFKCFFAVVFLGMGFSQAAIAFPALGKGTAAVRSVFEILDRESEIDPRAPGGLQPAGPAAGALELKELRFAYPSRPTVPILAGFTLSVPAQQTMALVGSSGSGKSTVILLIQRFYAPASGTITFDGHDISTLNLAWLRSQLGLVSQEPALFSTSIRENILFGREGASAEEVEAAARAANAHDFVSRLPQGYDTQVGERGVQMSGGQKQRIAIARAVLRSPRVLLLDEATSALDSESERLVQAALDTLMVGRTSIVIAHRLSTIRDAGCIAVVRKGEVLETGTHSELVARGGQYAELHRLQHGGVAGSPSAASL